VEWTDTGRALLADKSYRGISPVMDVEKNTGRVLLLRRAALTNTPNLTQLATLNHQESQMDVVRMRTLLGLAADADEAAILAAIERQAAERTAHAARVTELQAQVAAAVKPELVTQLQTQIAQLQADGARTRATAFIDKAIADGKPIAPLRDHYVTRHMANAADVETEIGKLPSIHTGGAGQHTVRHDAADGDGDGLTETESKVCQTMGIDPKKFAAAKKKKAA
jgi:phage I-like protein